MDASFAHNQVAARLQRWTHRHFNSAFCEPVPQVSITRVEQIIHHARKFSRDFCDTAVRPLLASPEQVFDVDFGEDALAGPLSGAAQASWIACALGAVAAGAVASAVGAAVGAAVGCYRATMTPPNLVLLRQTLDAKKEQLAAAVAAGKGELEKCQAQFQEELEVLSTLLADFPSKKAEKVCELVRLVQKATLGPNEMLEACSILGQSLLEIAQSENVSVDAELECVKKMAQSTVDMLGAFTFLHYVDAAMSVTTERLEKLRQAEECDRKPR